MTGVSTEIGQRAYGGDARLRVRLEQNNKRLKRYLGTRDPYMVSRLIPSARDWYIYYGTIPPQRIDTSITAAMMLECLDHQIATHPSPDARQRFKAERARVAILPRDVLLDFEI